MKFLTVLIVSSVLLEPAWAFRPATFMRTRSAALYMGFDLSGNTWKPDSGKMGSTDTGDFFPEDYDSQVSFTEGMMGSQSLLNKDRSKPELPGMENLGADAIMMGGIEEASEIPSGMQFIPSSVPDGEFVMNVAASSDGQDLVIECQPVCMTYEDFYASFSKDTHPMFRVTPQTGRMDRRGGEPTEFVVRCEPNGVPGTFVANLVINLPEDNSKICYKITAKSF